MAHIGCGLAPSRSVGTGGSLDPQVYMGEGIGDELNFRLTTATEFDQERNNVLAVVSPGIQLVNVPVDATVVQQSGVGVGVLKLLHAARTPLMSARRS